MTSPETIRIGDLPCQIRLGDVLERLREVPGDSVECVVTSPPYWGLRDYGVEGQLGLEPTLKEHIDKMVEVFEEVRRVLKPEGTCWINYGDCYATTPAGHKANADGRIRSGKDDRTFTQKPFSTIQGSLKPKDLCMVPNRLAIALQDAGWWVRGEIIWAKPNPMPESIRDRPASAHEKIWLVTKSARYFYDAEAVRQPVSGGTKSRGIKRRPPIEEAGQGHKNWCSYMGDEVEKRTHRNLRNFEPAPLEVWNVATRPFPEAHFATFPPELAQRCIKAGCPRGGVVLDPFGGAGTTGLVALRLGRQAILIELNPDYAAIAQERIAQDWMGPDELKSQQAATDLDAGPLFSRTEPTEVCNA
ncbi:site-specific DNA-methyltransferase [Pseudovibrio sp. Tun.PSC04-5.I4]|uniref:DNA-methyltransferase n=1 Tax=Pseudovibrio sp. Tun.PSC04-5.I4 TaxID=1798213 RepID=UPI000885D022|nr:site-specific DNA-methyltransferase [Pseudovibrio sp. Tun.PSC04-5.I4]SDR10988.1 DNA modification methylase [Pseudovibrio sp. Tun.PSC04-5.I4]SDR34987.1 DNA modification methylase [Pseudovibrio sp. Tun.PSC04-5.I4]